MTTFYVLRNVNLPEDQTITLARADGRTLPLWLARAGWTVVSQTTESPGDDTQGFGFVLMPSSAATDGQLLAWSETLGAYTWVNPAGGSELASAANISGAFTDVDSPGGLGDAVDIPGCVITVPPSNGRPVYIRFGGVALQGSGGKGDAYFSVFDVDSGDSIGADAEPLPNSTAGTEYLITFLGEVRIPPVTDARTFKLSVQLYTTAAAGISMLNGATNQSFIRAVSG